MLISVLRKRNAGNTLTETVIVVGVLGLVLGGIWVAANHVLEQVKREKFAEQITMTVNNVRAHYQSQPGISGDATSVTNEAIKQGLFPKDMVVDASHVVHAWGKAITVAPTSGGGYRQSFMVTLTDLKVDPCINVAMYLAGSKAPVGVVKIEIKGNSIKIPADLKEISGFCSDPSDVVVTYKLRAPQ